MLIVSFSHPLARRTAGISAHTPPPINPSTSINGNNAAAGKVVNDSAPQLANQAPIYSCPSAPTLTSPTRAGSATASAHRSTGTMTTSTSDRPYVPPSVELNMSA